MRLMLVLSTTILETAMIYRGYMQHLDPHPSSKTRIIQSIRGFASIPMPSNENDVPSVYACLPGKRSLNDIEHCAADNKSCAARVLKNKIF